MTILFCVISFGLGAYFGGKLSSGLLMGWVQKSLKAEGWTLEITKDGDLKVKKLYADFWYEQRND